MRKLTFLFIIFFFVISFSLYAQKNPFSDDTEDKKPVGVGNRSFEIGLVNTNVIFANNFLAIKKIFQDIVVVDLDYLADGFMVNLGLGEVPFYFTYNSKKEWGFGLSTDVEGIGILGLSGNMLTLREAVKENSDIGGALFASVTGKAFFNVQEFKVKVNPSLFYSLLYVTPSPRSSSILEYTLDYSKGTVLYADYDIRVYSGFSLDGYNGLTVKPGFDFSLGVEYPLSKKVELIDSNPFLDFDVSLDLINIPFIPSKMKDYKQFKGRIGNKDPIKFLDDEGGNFLSSFEPNVDSESGEYEIGVKRPFKMIVSANWRPIPGDWNKRFSVIPLIGFCHNELYYEHFSLEIGINGCLNLSNIFLAKIGFNYTDRMFVNSIDLGLNLRAFELDIGADLRSQKNIQSWKGDGLGLRFGLKFGW
jgi:hypothetical protein